LARERKRGRIGEAVAIKSRDLGDVHYFVYRN
jgi:hypothetical protein